MGQYDYIVIDCPPAVDSHISQSALLISDLVLIPVVPSPADLWAAVGIQELIERIKGINDGLIARLVVNMCQSNLNLTQEVLEVLRDFGIEMLRSRVCLRTVYRQVAALGKAVYGIKGAEKAMYEINDLKKEIIILLTI